MHSDAPSPSRQTTMLSRSISARSHEPSLAPDCLWREKPTIRIEAQGPRVATKLNPMSSASGGFAVDTGS